MSPFLGAGAGASDERSAGPTAVREEYERRLAARRAERQVVDRSHLSLGQLRLLALVASGVGAWLAWGRGLLDPWWIVLPLALFVGLGVRMARRERERDRLDRAIGLYQRGLARIAELWSGHGPTGSAFHDDDHPYARDLDLFGEGSLFQLLCAARTSFGKATLASWLLAPAAPEIVRARQEAVAELAERLDLREELAVLGAEVGERTLGVGLVTWGERPPRLDTGPRTRLAAAVGTLLGLTAIATLFTHLAASLGRVEIGDALLAGMRVWTLAVVLGSALAARLLRSRTATVLGGVEAAARELELLAALLERLEALAVEAPLLREYVARLRVSGQPPSRRIARLRRIVHLVDSRHGFFVRLFGPLLFWDLHLALALERWKTVSGGALRGWLAVVGEIEALASLARFCHERPETAFPTIVAEGPLLAASGLGHPLLPAAALVRNDIELGAGPHVLIVSGSNMSGKSTLLRAVGVAAVLAQAGAPVCAREARMSPMAVGASLRIQDSLREGTSRFYAEILRLRRIVTLAESGPALFLIDEFLHGTNSHDRRAGAEAIIRGLVARGAVGLVTTHDLALTGIADALGPEGRNVHFADELVDGRLHFDYRLRDGVVRKSNAIELMRSVGLEV